MSDEARAAPGPETRHLGVRIEASAEEIATWARDPRHLPQWAAGLASAEVHERDGRWLVESPMGTVEVAFAAPNPWGILDHDVTLPSGEIVTNPLRVIADGAVADVVFTVRRRGMSDEQFDADCAAVRADLETLRGLFERP